MKRYCDRNHPRPCLVAVPEGSLSTDVPCSLPDCELRRTLWLTGPEGKAHREASEYSIGLRQQYRREAR